MKHLLTTLLYDIGIIVSVLITNNNLHLISLCLRVYLFTLVLKQTYWSNVARHNDVQLSYQVEVVHISEVYAALGQELVIMIASPQSDTSQVGSLLGEKLFCFYFLKISLY